MKNLPDIEAVAAIVHASWMDGKRAKGIESRKAEDGEELMVPYALLSEAQKDQDRNLVKSVYAAIAKCPTAHDDGEFDKAVRRLVEAAKEWDEYDYPEGEAGRIVLIKKLQGISDALAAIKAAKEGR